MDNECCCIIMHLLCCLRLWQPPRRDAQAVAADEALGVSRVELRARCAQRQPHRIYSSSNSIPVPYTMTSLQRDHLLLLQNFELR
jgi:hypothetical protein